MSSLRGKSVLPRAAVKGMLLDMNHDVDGPWEPAIFVNAEALAEARKRPSADAWRRVVRSAHVGHDDRATHDLHLPGDDKPFDVAATVAKLLIAEVLEAP